MLCFISKLQQNIKIDRNTYNTGANWLNYSWRLFDGMCYHILNGDCHASIAGYIIHLCMYLVKDNMKISFN